MRRTIAKAFGLDDATHTESFSGLCDRPSASCQLTFRTGGSGKRSLPMVCRSAIGKLRRLRLPLPPTTSTPKFNWHEALEAGRESLGFFGASLRQWLSHGARRPLQTLPVSQVKGLSRLHSIYPSGCGRGRDCLVVRPLPFPGSWGLEGSVSTITSPGRIRRRRCHSRRPGDAADRRNRSSASRRRWRGPHRHQWPGSRPGAPGSRHPAAGRH